MAAAPLAAATAGANEIFCRCNIIETLNENEVSEQANVRVSGRYAETKKLNFDGTRGQTLHRVRRRVLQGNRGVPPD